MSSIMVARGGPRGYGRSLAWLLVPAVLIAAGWSAYQAIGRQPAPEDPAALPYIQALGGGVFVAVIVGFFFLVACLVSARRVGVLSILALFAASVGPGLALSPMIAAEGRRAAAAEDALMKGLEADINRARDAEAARLREANISALLSPESGRPAPSDVARRIASYREASEALRGLDAKLLKDFEGRLAGAGIPEDRQADILAVLRKFAAAEAPRNEQLYKLRMAVADDIGHVAGRLADGRWHIEGQRILFPDEGSAGDYSARMSRLKANLAAMESLVQSPAPAQAKAQPPAD